MGLVLLALAAGGCSAPEVRAAAQYLGCVAERDLKCLRRLSAPLMPRLQAWSVAYKADPLFIGAFARKIMVDADNPFGALSPGTCAQEALAARLPEDAASALGSCACTLASSRGLPPAPQRTAAFVPHRERALQTHPAMEILANRSAAEARRVTTLSVVRCTCAGKTVEAAVLDLQGRDPLHRVFHVTGACEGAAPMESVLRRAERLLSGDLTDTSTSAAPR